MQRKADDEARTSIAVLDGQRAAVALGDLPGDGEAEADSSRVPAACGVQPGEPLEYRLSLVGGDSGAFAKLDIGSRAELARIFAEERPALRKDS